jgi:hypothetical protein
MSSGPKRHQMSANKVVSCPRRLKPPHSPRRPRPTERASIAVICPSLR